MGYTKEALLIFVFMKHIYLASIQPITPEQHFKNLCSAVHDTTTKRFMRSLQDIDPSKALDAAAAVLKGGNAAWVEQLDAIIERFPEYNYKDVCSQLIFAEKFKEALEVLRKTPNTRLPHVSGSFFSKTSVFAKVGLHKNQPHVDDLTDLMFERGQMNKSDLFLLATRMKNVVGLNIVIDNYKKQPPSWEIDEIVGANSEAVIVSLRNKFNTPKFNLDLVEALFCNEEMDFFEHIQGCLKNITFSKRVCERLNGCLDYSIRYERIEHVKLLLPHYLPMHENGNALMTASETGNKVIFDLLADLTPRPDKILTYMKEIENFQDLESLQLLQECVDERAQIKQRDKILKVISKGPRATPGVVRRKM